MLQLDSLKCFQVDSWKPKAKARGPVKYREMVEELMKRAI